MRSQYRALHYSASRGKNLHSNSSSTSGPTKVIHDRFRLSLWRLTRWPSVWPSVRHAHMAGIIFSTQLKIAFAWWVVNTIGLRYLMIIKNTTVSNVAQDAVLSQRKPRDAPYRPIWVPWKFSRVAHGYFSRIFLWAFVPIDPMNVRTKFEVRSFTRSW